MQKFIDLEPQYQLIQADLADRWQRILQHQQFVNGPEVGESEAAMAKYLGVAHAVGVSNGTMALYAALLALDVQPDDEIILPAFSFFATAEVVLLLRAKPVFIDIDPRTFTLNPELIEAHITPKTKGIIAVSLYGQCADFDKINAIAQKHGLFVIEDAAQSFGATYKGKKSGSLTTIACASFFPSKPLGVYGDGGACFTQDESLGKRLRQVIHHGEIERYRHEQLGFNGRFNTMQAAVLLSKLPIFDQELSDRQKVAVWYNERLVGRLPTPVVLPHNTSAYAQYTVQVEERDAVRLAMSDRGIPTAVHYPTVMYRQPVMGEAYADVCCPQSELAASRVLSLPFYPYLTEKQVDAVCDALLSVVCEAV